MKSKSIFIFRLIFLIFIVVFLMYLLAGAQTGKIILIPLLIWNFSTIVKNLFIIMGKPRYVDFSEKFFLACFLLFYFGTLTYWCYEILISSNFISLLLSIPFWIGGVFIIRKKFFKTKRISFVAKLRSKFGLTIIGMSLLVMIAFLSGIAMLFFGVVDTYKENKKTKNYITTNGYYKDYHIYSVDKDGITYSLVYTYKVDDREYSITTDYGTSYIPEENSIRKVKFNPSNPEEAVLVGSSSKVILIMMGVFFILVSFTFVIIACTVLGYFDKFKIDVIGTYTGIIFLIIGIGVIILQNGTTLSLIKTIQSLGLWILIPFMFIVVGIIQIVKCLFLSRNQSPRGKK